LRTALANDAALRAALERAALAHRPEAASGQAGSDPHRLLAVLGVERAQVMALAETLLRSLAGEPRTPTQHYLFEQAVERALIARRAARLLALTDAQVETLARVALLEVLGLQLLLAAPRPCACTLEAVLARCADTGTVLPARHPFLGLARNATVRFARRWSLGEPLVTTLAGASGDASASRSTGHRNAAQPKTARVLALVRELADARSQLRPGAARARGASPTSPKTRYRA
jgi:hypothetical protein